MEIVESVEGREGGGEEGEWTECCCLYVSRGRGKEKKERRI
jgi:hypothetical protein